VPDYMVMGERGMADMGGMEMPLPENTHPMMTGTGPFGPLEMGGMFSVLKVRDNLKSGDWRDPGDYVQPTGTQAWEWQGEAAALPPLHRPGAAAGGPVSTGNPGKGAAQVRKPGHAHHGH